jgi:2-amino-4-hydroxy-6-hydroxymethyldihydropteridine diphosphokinase
MDVRPDRPLSAFVGLGGNVGDSRATLEQAVAALGRLPGAHVARVSDLYRTRPVGLREQADFHNAVVELRLERPGGMGGTATPEGAAMALLESLKGIERALGRQDRQRWGPREADLDLLLFGEHALRVQRSVDARSEAAGARWLEVPHPAARERLFVLAPLADLAPDLRPPGWGASVAEARDAAVRREGADAVVLVGTWDESRQEWAAGSS